MDKELINGLLSFLGAIVAAIIGKLTFNKFWLSQKNKKIKEVEILKKINYEFENNKLEYSENEKATLNKLFTKHKLSPKTLLVRLFEFYIEDRIINESDRYIKIEKENRLKFCLPFGNSRKEELFNQLKVKMEEQLIICLDITYYNTESNVISVYKGNCEYKIEELKELKLFIEKKIDKYITKLENDLKIKMDIAQLEINNINKNDK